MAELTTTQTPTPTEVTPTVVPVETPPVAVVARPVPGKPKSKDIRIPPAAFKERIRREANGQAKELLGMTLEEAAQRLRAAPAAAVASQGESTADAELIKLQAQIVRANKEAAAATKRAVDAENKAKKDARRLADAEVTAGLKLADRKSTRLNSSHLRLSRMPSSA